MLGVKAADDPLEPLVTSFPGWPTAQVSVRVVRNATGDAPGSTGWRFDRPVLF
jgi:hypothetical protein